MSRSWWLACAWMLATGCDSVEDFRTKPGEVFHGDVIGSDSVSARPSFIREGFPSHTEMELTFDPDTATVHSDAGAQRRALPRAGTIHTYQCPPEADLCTQAARKQGAFDHAALEHIVPLSNDTLSEYDFPGGGRLRNYILGARFGTQSLQRSATVFLSLMENGTIEVRVLSASVLDQDMRELAPALFGVFSLERRAL